MRKEEEEELDRIFIKWTYRSTEIRIYTLQKISVQMSDDPGEIIPYQFCVSGMLDFKGLSPPPPICTTCLKTCFVRLLVCFVPASISWFFILAVFEILISNSKVASFVLCLPQSALCSNVVYTDGIHGDLFQLNPAD